MTVTMPYLDDCFINIKMTVSKSAETWWNGGEGSES
jgi:hypothetical protein